MQRQNADVIYFVLAGIIASITLVIAAIIESKRCGRKPPIILILVGVTIMFIGHMLTVVYRTIFPSFTGVLICIIAELVIFLRWKAEIRKKESDTAIKNDTD